VTGAVFRDARVSYFQLEWSGGMNKIKDFTCPKCGHNVLKTASKPERHKDFPDAICAGCGAPATESDIRKQAGKILDKLVRDAVRKNLP
jgi:hypothetical protein